MKAVAIMLISAFFGVMVITLVEPHEHHQGCPLMPGSSALCTMTPLDHSDIARAISSSLLPYVLIAISVVGLFVPGVYRVLDQHTQRVVRKRHALLPQPLYRQLSAQGLLNPIPH